MNKQIPSLTLVGLLSNVCVCRGIQNWQMKWRFKALFWIHSSPAASSLVGELLLILHNAAHHLLVGSHSTAFGTHPPLSSFTPACCLPAQSEGEAHSTLVFYSACHHKPRVKCCSLLLCLPIQTGCEVHSSMPAYTKWGWCALVFHSACLHKLMVRYTALCLSTQTDGKVHSTLPVYTNWW